MVWLETEGCREPKDSILGCCESFVQLDSCAIRGAAVASKSNQDTAETLDSAVY